MTEQLSSTWQHRLANWKFQQALALMPAIHQRRRIVECLAGLFGDAGWFEGEVGALVEMVVDVILETEEKEQKA